MSDQSAPRTIHAAMVALRTGKITPDQFRDIMRANRVARPDQHDADKFRATAAFEGGRI